MDLWKKVRESKLVLLILVLLPLLTTARITNKGYLNAGKEINISFDNVNPDDCLEYSFMTNYKKVYFSLTTVPSKDVKYRQRILLTDMPFSKCPQRCTEEPNYCTAISNKIFSETQATFSKCFPTLYIYIINQPPVANNLQGFIDSGNYCNIKIDSASDFERSGDSNFEISTTLNSLQQNQDVVGPTEVSETTPVFTLTPTHLQQGCKILDNLVPQCASLANEDCINPAFCTTECGLLTCKSSSGENLFSLCTTNNLTQTQLEGICSGHENYVDTYKWSKCQNPIEYNPSISETAVSIFLVCCVMMTLLVVCVCCYNLRLLKTGEVPCDVCPFCPDCLFPREVEDNPLYKDNDKESNNNFMF